MVFDTYTLMDILAGTNFTTVIRMASTCKLVRQCILQRSFLFSLNLKPAFAPSLLLGHFLTFRDNRHTMPQFVKSPFAENRFVTDIKENLDEEVSSLHDSLDDFSAMGQDGSYMVLRKHEGTFPLCLEPTDQCEGISANGAWNSPQKLMHPES